MVRDPFWQGILAVILLVVLLGHQDAAEADRQDQEYCDMVRSGHWPDFKGTYSGACKNPQKGATSQARH